MRGSCYGFGKEVESRVEILIAVVAAKINLVGRAGGGGRQKRGVGRCPAEHRIPIAIDTLSVLSLAPVHCMS
jgi:hypothetical protein